MQRVILRHDEQSDRPEVRHLINIFSTYSFLLVYLKYNLNGTSTPRQSRQELSDKIKPEASTRAQITDQHLVIAQTGSHFPHQIAKLEFSNHSPNRNDREIFKSNSGQRTAGQNILVVRTDHGFGENSEPDIRKLKGNLPSARQLIQKHSGG